MWLFLFTNNCSCGWWGNSPIVNTICDTILEEESYKVIIVVTNNFNSNKQIKVPAHLVPVAADIRSR